MRKTREFIARSNVDNIVFDSDKAFGEIGETPVLDRKQQVEKDMEMFEININPNYHGIDYLIINPKI